MNINHLRYFQEVCKYENITKASEVIHISQPSVTSAIKDLENELGFQLFIRNGNRISLTPEGARFLEMTNDMLLSFDNFYSKAVELGECHTTTLRVGIPAILGTFFFERIIPVFEQQNPNIHLTIHEVPTITGIRMVNDAHLDFLIGVIEDDFCSCNFKLIFETDLVFFSGRDHPLAKKKVISKDMLANQPFIMVPKGSYHYKVISERYKAPPLNTVLYSNQVSTIAYMLKNNLAATILYKQVFEKDKNVCSRPLSEPLTAKIGIFWKKNIYVTNAMKKFIQFTKTIQA